mmetsp:Transcript_10817/g.40568  ORF Transcript_10817/g.40568 Transcript_10817/m.40568 type:complete len:272 (+) Transcript_10817:229-1044(+)
MERDLWLLRVVHVQALIADHGSRVVVDYRVDDAIPNGLGHHMLRRTRRPQRKDLRNVVQVDPGVRHRDPPKSDLDHVVRKPLGNDVVAVTAEVRRLLCEHLVEALNLPFSHRLREAVVARELLPRPLLQEDLPLRDVSHEQLHENLQLLRLQLEATRCGGGRLAQRLLQSQVRVAVVQLDRLHAAEIVQIPTQLVVADGLREVALVHQLVRVVHRVEREVVPQQKVEKHRPADLVVLQARRAMRAKQHEANIRVAAGLLVGEGVVLVHLGS